MVRGFHTFMFNKIIKSLPILICLFLLKGVALAGPPPFCYQEIDGSPSGCYKKLKVSNGALTDNGDGSFTLVTGVGGGGDVSGGASSVDREIVVYDGVGGKTIQAGTSNQPTISAAGAITVPSLTASRALTTDASKVLTSSSVTSTELGYLSGVTSAIQTQIDGKQAADADLTTYAGITPSANVQTLLGSADYAAFKTSLSLNNVENTALSTWAGSTNLVTLGADAVDALTEIAQTIKTAADDTSKLVVGTAGATNDCAKWDSTGALVSAGAACGSGSGAPTDATYITQTANGTLSAEQALSSLSTGIMRVATTTGVITSLTDSSGIATNISDETGSGALVFGTSPTIATPVLTLEDGNGAAPTTDGRIKYDRTTERLQVGDGTTTSEFVKVGTLTDTKACIWDSASKSIVCNSTGGSDTNAVKEYWWPASATLPLEAADSIPPISKITGTNVDVLAVSFDSGTDECRTAHLKVPSDVQSGSTITFRIIWFSQSATTNNVVWDARYQSTGTEGESFDQTLTTKSFGADAVQGTVKQITVSTVTETLANLGWAANDSIEIAFCRDADNASDNMTGDAEAIGFGVEIPRA